jgi:hypothetical protein
VSQTSRREIIDCESLEETAAFLTFNMIPQRLDRFLNLVCGDGEAILFVVILHEHERILGDITMELNVWP